MTFNKRKKNSRQRGSTFHGWGKGKAHHKGGGGNRGGHGNAGFGKRAGHRKPSRWILGRHYGKLGFKSKVIQDVRPINLEVLNDMMLRNKIKDSVNLADLGFNKLLGKGKLEKKLKITTEYASSNAVEKVKAMGGEVILPKAEKTVQKED